MPFIFPPGVGCPWRELHRIKEGVLFMKHMRKGIALLLATLMIVPNIPAFAENVQSETQTEDVEDVTETTEKEAQNVEETQLQEEIESADDATVFYNTGNYEVGIMEDDFAEDGSYTINIPEENPFFPYEVQFTCDGEVTDEWFMTPDDTVEIGGHTFKVSAYFDNTVVTQMSLNVAGDTVAVYPEKKEFTNDGDGTMEMSLLPLTQRNLTVDLTGYTPIELTMVSTDSIFTGADALKDTDKVVWKRKWSSSDSYEISQTGDKLDLSVSTYYNTSQTWEMIVGSGDQLDLSSVRYSVTVNTTESENWLLPIIYGTTADGTRESLYVSEAEYYDYDKDERRFTTEVADINHSNIYMAVKVNDVIYQNKKYASLKAYEGKYASVAELAGAPDVTDKIFAADMTKEGAGYEFVGYNGTWITIEALDSVGTVIGILPVRMNLYNTDPEGYILCGPMSQYSSGRYEYVNDTTDGITDSNGVVQLTYKLYKGYSASDRYYMNFYYHKMGQQYNAAVTAAYAGQYATIAEAQAAGASDIKEDLFELNGKRGYETDYSQGVDFTIFIGNDGEAGQQIYRYRVKTVEGEKVKPNFYSSSTGVTFTGLNDGNGNSLNSYIVKNTEDSYAEYNYITIMVEENVDLSNLAPVFYTDAKVNLYAANGNIKEVSGQSYHDFSSGSVQYTAVAEDGKNSKNYWLQIVKVSDSADLYINSLSDPEAKTVEHNNVVYSIREIMLDGYHNYYHDIVVANMGKQSIPNLKVELNSNQVTLDDYWTLSGNYELSKFSLDKIVSTENVPNVAKIRLKAKDGVEAGTNVSGTVTIKSGETALMVLTLTGIVGDPSITTKDIPAAVKYVPYGTVIQNNNKYSWNKTSYTMVSGTLPAGMTIRENGEIYGVPQETGEFTFTVRMNNSESSFKSDEATYTLKVLDNTNENVENATDSGYEFRERLSNIVLGATGADSQKFVSIGELDEFQALYLDGQELTKGSDYSAERGSTRITISTQTLSRGGKGSHTIALEFRQKDTDTLKRAAQNYIVSDQNTNSGNNNSNGNSGNSGNQTSGNSGSSNSGSSSGGSSTSNVTGTNGTVSQTEKDSQIATQKTITYTVAAGDTLSKIALKMYGDRKFWRKIYADNKDVLKNPNRIYVGQKLTLYFDQDETQNQSDADSTVKANTYVIKPGDTLWKIATKLYKKGYYWKNIYEANRKTIKSPEKIRVGQMIELP